MKHDFFKKKPVWFGIFALIAVIAWITEWAINGNINNYLIYKGVFEHSLQQLPLYVGYPNEYFDQNHYGPFFSLLIAPFALLPDSIGILLWLLALCLLLAYSLQSLPLKQEYKVFIFWFCALEAITSAQNLQFNLATAAMIVLSFTCIDKKKDFWAALWIVIGTFVKLYGIVGLAFFFFSKQKGKLILSLLFWSAIAFVLPMLISSPEYILSQYTEWAKALSFKNGSNLFSGMQNVSLLGMVRKISGNPDYSDLWIIIPGILSFGGIYLRVKQYSYLAFRLLLLCATLLFTVLFSTGSESCSYIIALIGVAVWYKTYPCKRPYGDLILLILCFILCIFSPTDLFPEYIRLNFVRPYALKALPCALIYFRILYELYTKDFSKYLNINANK